VSTTELPPRNISLDNVLTYPNISKGKDGDVIKVLIESRWLTITNAAGKNAWGTDIYTSDSDLVKAVAHSEKIKITDKPPQHNIIVTIRFLPGQLSYNGSTRQGIITNNYGSWGLSYPIEDVKTIPLTLKRDFSFTYPNISKGKIEDVIKILIESQWLTTTHVTTKNAWGTDIYTDDSDLVKDLTDVPPQYDIIATIRFLPGQSSYNGSTRQKITTNSYGSWGLSYSIE
ncbi:14340_t:CDS:2, partial [Dentiscutata heterogama]